TRWPSRARTYAWRRGPQPTSSTRAPGFSARASTRNATSWAVPLVKEYRRYAGPRWSARASNQCGPPLLPAELDSPGGADPLTGDDAPVLDAVADGVAVRPRHPGLGARIEGEGEEYDEDPEDHRVP